MAEKLGSVVVEGTLFWTFLMKKNGKKYSVDIGNFTDEGREKLKGLAFEAGRTKNKFIKQKEGHPADGGEYVTLTSLYPIDNLYHPSGEQLSEDELKKLGSGTRVTARVEAFTTYSQEYGLNIGASLVLAKVTDYVEYTSSGSYEDEMGFEGELKTRERPKQEAETVVNEKTDTVDLSDLDDDIPFGQEAVA